MKLNIEEEWKSELFYIAQSFLRNPILREENTRIIIFYVRREKKNRSFVWFPCPICIEYHMIITSTQRGFVCTAMHGLAGSFFLLIEKISSFIYVNSLEKCGEIIVCSLVAIQHHFSHITAMNNYA